MKHSCHLIERLLYMNLLFLASFILFLIWFTARMHIQKKKEKNFNADFWKKELCRHNNKQRIGKTFPISTPTGKEHKTVYELYDKDAELLDKMIFEYAEKYGW